MSNASAYFTVNGINGKHGVSEIKRGIDMLNGVNSVSVSGQSVAVDFDPTGASSEQIKRMIEKLGYSVSDSWLDKAIM
jgi:Copper chaperone